MMCRPEEHDLRHAARRALADAAARGLAGEERIRAAVAEVGAIWAHVPPETVQTAVRATLAETATQEGGRT